MYTYCIGTYVPSESKSELCVCEKFPPGGGGGGVLYRHTQHTPEEDGGGEGGSRARIFIKICTNRAFLCVFQPFLLLSFILISLKSEPLRIWILSVRS